MEDPAARQELELEVGGQKFRSKGYRLVDLAVFLILSGIVMVVYQLYEHKLDAKEAGDKHVKALEKQAEVSNEMNYILTLSPQDREKLNLSMPYSLRQKIENRRWETK